MSILDPTYFLFQMEPSTLLGMLWFLLILDIPRYTLAFMSVVIYEVFRRPPEPAVVNEPLVTVVIVGHNERPTIRRCITSLREQSYRNIEIVCVDDGSTDGMAEELRKLRAEGLVDDVLTTSPRCGKPSACNLAFGRSRGDIIVNADVDCTFDRDAIASVVAPLADPKVGAVSGNIGVRDAEASLISGLQSVEYLISISLGKRALDFFDIVTCASGAFSAFRRQALESVGGLDVGPGEDLDVTLRLRKAGWKVRFAKDAWCLTTVPATIPAFVRQRLRWERDAIRLRLRKHKDIINPTNRAFYFSEFLHNLDFLFTNIIITFAFPAYLAWIFYQFGGEAWTILVLVTMSYVLLDFIAVGCALAAGYRPGAWRVWPYVIPYGAFNAFFMRGIRIYAYVQEWIFRTSYTDRYIPTRVLKRAPWY
jgi:cellulose synthase/poly-beta-1,6-N-acetylglucosamine synthase-like glycosyltransferase